MCFHTTLALLSLFLVFFFSLLCSLNQSLSFTAQLTALLLCETFSSSSVTDASLLCVVKTKECIYCNSIVQQIAVGIIETHLLL